MRSVFVITAICFLAAWLNACGTEVDVGRNQERGRLTDDAVGVSDGQSDDGGSGDGLDGSGDGDSGDVGDGFGDDGDGVGDAASDGGGESDGGTDQGEGTGQKLTCFGPAPSLDADLEAFCALQDETRRAAFASAFDLICNQRRLVNLFLEPCSWPGDERQTSFRRVLERTDLTDQTTEDFYFLGAYSVTSQSSLEDQIALIKREFNDPAYTDTFVSIRNSKISNIVPNADNGYDYTAELASSSSIVRFRANLAVVQVTPDLVVIFDRNIGDEVLIKEHHFMRILRRLDEGRTRMIGLDEKLVDDSGNHRLAYQNVMEVLMQRMGRDYENSLRD